MFVNVSVPSILYESLTYEWNLNKSACIGELVEVNLRGKNVVGFVTATDVSIDSTKFQIKSVVKSFNIFFDALYLDFIYKFIDYNMIPIGLITKFITNNVIDVNIDNHSEASFNYNFNKVELSNEQLAVFNDVATDLSSFKVNVIQGVTGSGKTEVYFELCEKMLKNNKKVLILFPEIGLTNSFIERFYKKFGINPFVWHSKISKKQKNTILDLSLSDQPIVVIGARSALFLPFKNLGLIIVDEEHDFSYKQEDVMLYHARDMAILKAKTQNIPILLCSATLSLETYFNATNNKYKLNKLSSRFYGNTMPKIHVLNMKDLSLSYKYSKFNFNNWLHPKLLQAIESTVLEEKQVLLFLNKRGYFPIALCNSCNEKVKCKNCDIALVLHKHDLKMHCHYCNYQEDQRTICSSCGALDIIYCGCGVEKLEEEINKIFPQFKTLSVTSDLVNTSKKINEMIKSISNKEVKIIIATQMLSKGYDFSDIETVGIIDADRGFYNPDLRALEKTFQQLMQVSGRCGRKSGNGNVYVQTFDVDNIAIKVLQNDDIEQFYQFELEDRKNHNMPPYSRMCSVIISAKDYRIVEKFCSVLNDRAIDNKHVIVLGAVKAPIAKIKNTHRYRFLLKYNVNFKIQNYLKSWIFQLKIPNDIRVTIDIDPVSFY